MKTFKILLTSFIGTLLAIILVAFIYAQYSDYRAMAQTYNWLTILNSVKVDIENNLLTGNKINIIKPKFSPEPKDFLIRPDGIILMRGGRDGQLLVLIPEIKESKVQWTCYVGSSKAAPSECR